VVPLSWPVYNRHLATLPARQGAVPGQTGMAGLRGRQGGAARNGTGTVGKVLAAVEEFQSLVPPTLLPDACKTGHSESHFSASPVA
jgi:hypothetical protein